MNCPNASNLVYTEHVMGPEESPSPQESFGGTKYDEG